MESKRRSGGDGRGQRSNPPSGWERETARLLLLLGAIERRNDFVDLALDSGMGAGKIGRDEPESLVRRQVRGAAAEIGAIVAVVVVFFAVVAVVAAVVVVREQARGGHCCRRCRRPCRALDRRRRGRG